MDIKRINDGISVSGQIAPEDFSALKAQGFATVINNRPDGEAPDQPSNADMQAAAEAVGLAYHYIPLGRDGVNDTLVQQTKAAIEASSGPVFAFCRSGTRSTTLWALSQTGEMDANEIITQAAHAGYDMSHLAGHLNQK